MFGFFAFIVVAIVVVAFAYATNLSFRTWVHTRFGHSPAAAPVEAELTKVGAAEVAAVTKAVEAPAPAKSV